MRLQLSAILDALFASNPPTCVPPVKFKHVIGVIERWRVTRGRATPPAMQNPFNYSLGSPFISPLQLSTKLSRGGGTETLTEEGATLALT